MKGGGVRGEGRGVRGEWGTTCPIQPLSKLRHGEGVKGGGWEEGGATCPVYTTIV